MAASGSDTSLDRLPVYLIAFDVETSGWNPEQHHIISLGAAAVDTTGVIHDLMHVNAYVPEETNFEERCKRTFWDKHPGLLQSFKVDPDKSRTTAEKEMIEKFDAFRCKHEEAAARLGWQCVVVSDNKLFDGAWVNHLYSKYTGKCGLPYEARQRPDDQGQATQPYGTFVETHSAQMGLLMALEGGGLMEWNCTEAVTSELCRNNSKWLQRRGNDPRWQMTATRSTLHHPHIDALRIAGEFIDVQHLGINMGRQDEPRDRKT